MSFAQVIRQIGKTLQQPITMLSIENENIGSWNQNQGCPSPDEINEITHVTEKIDAIVSQVANLLPYSEALATAQYIIGPLLEQVANDLEGKPISQEQESALAEQVAQQARFSIMSTTHLEQTHLRSKLTSTQKEFQFGLPIFHIKKGVNHIDLSKNNKVHRVPIRESNGKIFSVIPKGTQAVGEERQVYFNHLAQKWEMTGDGRFNRFSKKEQRLVHKFALGTHDRYQPKKTDKTTLFSVKNPFTTNNDILEAVEMFGRLVPYHYDSEIGKSFIYDASQSNGKFHEVVLTRKEWHLLVPKNKRIKIESIYSHAHGRNLNVAVVRKINGLKIFAQLNTKTGFFRGREFVINKDGNLEFIPSKLKKYESSKNKSNTAVSVENKNPSENRDNELDKEINEDQMKYDKDNNCFRVKRGSVFGKICDIGNDLPHRADETAPADDNTNEIELDEAGPSDFLRTAEDTDNSISHVRTKSENALFTTDAVEFNNDIKINSPSGLELNIGKSLNEVWFLDKIKVKNSNYDKPEVIGSKIDVTFTMVYRKKTGMKNFKEIPALEWNENIKVKDGDSIWSVQNDMYQHNPKSMTFFSWRNRYVEAYNYAKEKDKSSFNGSVKIYKKNRKPLSYKDIREASSPAEMTKVIQNYLAKHGGVLEVEVIDLPQFVKRDNVSTKERLLSFNIGFNKEKVVSFNQGIFLYKDGMTNVFVTTSKDISLSEGEVNAKAPEIIIKPRDKTLSVGEVTK